METSKIFVTNITKNSNFYIGLTLAISSSVFIGSSFIIKKLSLIRLNRKGSIRAGAGGFGYLNDWMWWLGLLTMGIGELANFTAYTFAPASLVTPLGALSVLVSTILAAKFLNETLNLVGKMGCFLCLLGSTIFVMHAPKDEQLESFDELLVKLHDPAFKHYVLIILIIVVIVFSYVGPHYGNKYVTVYVSLCSAVGSLTVMACKALGLAIKESLSALPSHSKPNPWITCCLFATVVICICVQMNYLNKVLDLFSTSIVTPIYYVLFTTLVIVASAILFKEWKKMEVQDISGAMCGFLVMVISICLLNSNKESPSQILFKHASKEYGSGYVPRSV